MNRFESLNSARTELSGVQDWQFAGAASFDGLCEYASRNATHEQTNDEIIAAYLLSVGENPADYSISAA